MFVLLLSGVVAWAGSTALVGWSSESGVHPGVLVGLEAPLGSPGSRVEGRIGGSARVSHHRHRHTRLMGSLDGGLSVRLGVVSLDLRAGAGAGATLLAGPTYVMGDDGGYTRVPLAGQWGWMPWSMLGASGPLPVTGLGWFARAGMLAQVPYHDHWAPFWVSEVGVWLGRPP